MLFFGHLGIGSQMVTAWPKLKATPKFPLLLGTILPDLIDKPIYYSLTALTGKRGLEIDLAHGTRSFAHTLLFLLILSIFYRIRKSQTALALALGIATHLILDSFIDLLINEHTLEVPLFWPLPGWEFPVAPFSSIQEHFLLTILRPLTVGTELIGLVLLIFYLRPRSRSRLPHIHPNR